jgi:hypothetical protein
MRVTTRDIKRNILHNDLERLPDLICPQFQPVLLKTNFARTSSYVGTGTFLRTDREP